MAATHYQPDRLSFLHITRGDWNGFLTLGTDNLAKIVILPAILMGAFHFSPEIVFGGTVSPDPARARNGRRGGLIVKVTPCLI